MLIALSWIEEYDCFILKTAFLREMRVRRQSRQENDEYQFLVLAIDFKH